MGWCERLAILPFSKEFVVKERLISIATLPNAISTSRAIIAWVSVALIWRSIAYRQTCSATFWLCAFVFAVALDALDGWVARRLGTSSSLGSYIDILMDRLTEYPAWILLSYLVPLLRPIILVIVIRDVLVDGVKLASAYRGIEMERGVPKMIAPAELLVNHPASKTAYNTVKVLAIIIGLGSVIYSKELHLVAVILLAIHALYCVLRGLGSMLELRSIWSTRRSSYSQRTFLRYVFQCAIGLVVLGIIIGSFLHPKP